MNTIHAPELRSATERCITTRTGIAIGRCYVRQPLARVAGSVGGPHRRPGIAARVLGAMGGMRALFVYIAICAAALLLSACGPTDASYAWVCYFDTGNRDSSRKPSESCAVAIRHIPIGGRDE